MSGALMRDAALAYAAAGWALVPLEPGIKKPLIRTGRDHAGAATCDREQVSAWWSRWPDAGIGVVCAAGGFVVIDVDGEEGRKSFLEHPGPFPATCASRSGREGYGVHWWYRLPPGAEVPRGRLLAPGLEVKGAGNLVVAPPSLHRSGRRYAWDVPPPFMAEGRYPVAPQPLAVWMDVERPEPVPVPKASAALNGAVATKYGAKAMREELDRLARAVEGERNDTLYRVAVRLAELAGAGHVDEAEARRRVELAAEHAYQGGERREREATIASAFRKAGAPSTSVTAPPDPLPVESWSTFRDRGGAR
jgi:hypothetical protein